MMYDSPEIDGITARGDGYIDDSFEVPPYGDGPSGVGDTKGGGWGGVRNDNLVSTQGNFTTDLGIWFEPHNDLQTSVMTAVLASLIRRPR